ncbi:MAG TPA: HAMP domain-containing sensor histidine kinase [Candidatus Saccharimonadales bacterium]|nr:HAMP domain-containing sensor histidine kinase [Candidatus Saccharimonadales bacterium]
MLTIIVLAVLTIGQFVLGLLLWLEGERTKRIDQRLFGFIAFLIVLWTLSVGYLTRVDVNESARHPGFFISLNAFTFLLSCTIVLLTYVFTLYYPVKHAIGVWQRVVLSVGSLISLAAATPVIAGHFSVEQGKLIYSYGGFSFLVVAYTVFMTATIYFESVKLLRHTRELRLRRQTRTLLLGITLTFIHTLLFVLILPSLFGQKTILYAVGYAAPYWLLALTSYGLLRQGLFDVRAVIARSTAYTLSLLVVAALYVTPVVLLTGVILHAPLHASTLAILATISLLVAFLFEPVKTYFNRITNKIFYRDFYDPQDVLDQLSTLLVGTVDIKQIAVRTEEILLTCLHPTKVGFLFLADASMEREKLIHQLLELNVSLIFPENLVAPHMSSVRNELRRADVALAVRLRTTHEDLGFLLLGARRSGAAYTQGDQRLLSAVADELAIGLQNALRFEEIERFNITLQEKITDATRNLRRANDKLRKLNETKDDFISMASHQLRTPLTSVKGYVSMVLDGDAGQITKLQRKLLTQSFISSQRMVYLISDLLNVSRLKTGKFVIEPVPCNLAHVIQEEVEQLEETAKGRHLTLTYHKPEHFPTLLLDETKLRQVIMNFVDNAVYYTPSGGHIDINLVDKPQSIEFTVVDDGIGVPRHEQHHLFTKFFRAPNAKRARPDGTGLGLFMAKKVIVAQGGAVIFSSKENRGSTFGFTFAKAPLLPTEQRV